MKKMTAYAFCGALASGICAGMEECPDVGNSDNSTFELSVTSSKMNSHQVIEYFRQKNYADDIDNNILMYLANRGRAIGAPFGCLARHHASPVQLFNSEPVQHGESKARTEMMSWLDNFFPTGDNRAQLSQNYGNYEFNYGSGPCKGFYMSISLPEYKDYVYALLDKNGWVVLFQFGNKEWHYGDMYSICLDLNFNGAEEYLSKSRALYL